MKFVIAFLFSMLSILPFLSAQNSGRIVVDGKFDDWSTNSQYVSRLDDASNDGGDVDIKYIEVSNDDDYLFMHFELSAEIDIVDDFETPSRMKLFIDADNNANTGLSVNGIGADYLFDFRNRDVIYYTSNTNYTYYSFYDMGYAHLPTVTSEEFELLMDRYYFNQPVFTNTIKLFLKEDIDDDETEVMTYTMINDMPDFQPIDMSKPNLDHFRLLTYNTLQDGLLENDQAIPIKRIIAAADPDIIHLNEVYDTPAFFVENEMEDILDGDWTAHKYNGENIVASRYPIITTYEIYYGRLGAALIDLPDDKFDKDLLAVVGHLSCCGKDDQRQDQVDALIEFLADAKTPGGILTLEEGTPMLFSGDMNFVGYDEQINTVIDGNIMNNNVYGPDTKPDWDNGNFSDFRPLQMSAPTATTWNTKFPDPGDYPSGRLDFVFYGSSALQPRKGFVINTRDLSDEDLSAYGLLQSDSYFASDHLPLVTDFSGLSTNSVKEAVEAAALNVYPNPVGDVLFFESEEQWTYFKIFNMEGKLIREASLTTREINLSGLESGSYILELSNNKFEVKKNFIKQ